MPYVPEDKRTPAWYIFNTKFMCRMRSIDRRSKEHIRMFGMPASGDAEFDRTMMNEVNVYYLTIDEMFEYWRAGVTVGVVKNGDTRVIYEYIRDHLKMWHEHMAKSLNLGDVPLEDLKKLDEFAGIVYSHAKSHYREHFIESPIARQLMGSMPLPALVSNMEKEAAQAEEENRTTTQDIENQIRAAKKPTLSSLFASRRKEGMPSWK
jgi:hypothetical protein